MIVVSAPLGSAPLGSAPAPIIKEEKVAKDTGSSQRVSNLLFNIFDGTCSLTWLSSVDYLGD